MSSVCWHQPDGMMYQSNPPQMKCTLCGEFYTPKPFNQQVMEILDDLQSRVDALEAP